MSKDLLRHHWVCYKIYNFLVKRVLLQHSIARQIMSLQNNLHKKTEFHYYGGGLFVSVEYVSNPLLFFFRVKSFIAIYE
jgi:hypothetical protein